MTREQEIEAGVLRLDDAAYDLGWAIGSGVKASWRIAARTEERDDALAALLALIDAPEPVAVTVTPEMAERGVEAVERGVDALYDCLDASQLYSDVAFGQRDHAKYVVTAVLAAVLSAEPAR